MQLQSPSSQARARLREPTYLPALGLCPVWGGGGCGGGWGWRHLRHITGPLIKTHVRQSDRHGKTVWKKLLGIKYIVTTWFQRFINKLTDHLVSIRSDRSTNPGISALGLVGGGRRWLSMRGDIEGKSPCQFQGGPLLTLFQRGSMRVQNPFYTSCISIALRPGNQAGIREEEKRKAEERHADLLWERGRSIEFAGGFVPPPARTNGAVKYANKPGWLSLFTSMRLLCSHLRRERRERGGVAGGREMKRGALPTERRKRLILIQSCTVFRFRFVRCRWKLLANSPHLFRIFHEFSMLCSPCKEQTAAVRRGGWLSGSNPRDEVASWLTVPSCGWCINHVNYRLARRWRRMENSPLRQAPSNLVDSQTECQICADK